MEIYYEPSEKQFVNILKKMRYHGSFSALEKYYFKFWNHFNQENMNIVNLNIFFNYIECLVFRTKIFKRYSKYEEVNFIFFNYSWIGLICGKSLSDFELDMVKRTLGKDL